MEGVILGSLAIGIICVIISFVFKEKPNLREDEKEKFISEINKRILGEENLGLIIAEAKTKLSNSIEDLMEEQILGFSDKTNQNANEKMLAIQEMANVLLEKMEQNHKEVVFLYDMLNQKNDEMKAFYAQFENLKKDLQEEEKQLGMAYNYIQKKMRLLNTKISEKLREKEIVRADFSKNDEGRSLQKNSKKIEEDGEKKETENKEDLHINERILKLSKEGKSVLEISKELEMGQGEVKLILELYSNIK